MGIQNNITDCNIMAEDPHFLSLAFGFGLSIFVAFFFGYQWSDQKQIETALNTQGIQGQYGHSLPFLGHLAQFFDSQRLELSQFDRPNMPKVEYLTLFGNPLLVINDPELCFAFWNQCRNWDKSAMFYSLMDILFGSTEKTLITHTNVSSKLWQVKRSVTSQSFHKENMTKLAAFIDIQVVALCDEWVQRGTGVHVDHDLTALTLRVILFFIFGVDVSVQEVQPLQEALVYMVEFAWTFNTNPLNAMKAFLPGTQAYQASKTYRTFVRNLIAKAKQSQDDSIHQHLIYAMLKQSDWPDEVLENEIMTLIFAGHDTTAHATAIALDHCIHHPTIVQSIRDEYHNLLSNRTTDDTTKLGVKAFYSNMKWPAAAFKESLRLNPETPGGSVRLSPEDTQLDSILIPKGCSVLCPMWVYARSKKNWGVDAGEFRPERFLVGTTNSNSNDGLHRNYVSFSQGKRNCVGMPMAQMEGSMLLGYILTHLDITIQVPLKKQFAVTLRVDDFVVKVRRRHPGWSRDQDTK